MFPIASSPRTSEMCAPYDTFDMFEHETVLPTALDAFLDGDAHTAMEISQTGCKPSPLSVAGRQRLLSISKRCLTIGHRGK